MGRQLFAVCALLALTAGTQAQNYATNQLSTSALTERAQRGLFSDVQGSYLLPIATGGTPASNRVNNAAGVQFQADKSAFPFLATLPNQGSAVFISTLKPCGIIQPHVHPRATEQYVVIAGQMQAGIAEESGGRQNLTFPVYPGQSFVVPQGLVHFNTNRQCTSNVFIQVFNSADPGTIPLSNALSSLRAVDPNTLQSTGLGSVNATSFGAFGLDQECVTRCGLQAPNYGGTSDLSRELQAFIGMASAPGAAPSSNLVLPRSPASAPVSASSSG